MEVGLGPGDFVLDGYPAPPHPKRVGAPKFSAHVYCRQTARWIKMVLGTEVGLSPGDFVLDGDRVPLNFRPMHVYYTYCDFVRTLHRRKALLVCSSSSSSLVFYAFYVLESLIVLSLSRYAQLHHSADSWRSRSCKLVAFKIVNFVSGEKTLNVQMDDFDG